MILKSPGYRAGSQLPWEIVPLFADSLKGEPHGGHHFPWPQRTFIPWESSMTLLCRLASAPVCTFAILAHRVPVHRLPQNLLLKKKNKQKQNQKNSPTLCLSKPFTKIPPSTHGTEWDSDWVPRQREGFRDHITPCPSTGPLYSQGQLFLDIAPVPKESWDGESGAPLSPPLTASKPQDSTQKQPSTHSCKCRLVNTHLVKEPKRAFGPAVDATWDTLIGCLGSSPDSASSSNFLLKLTPRRQQLMTQGLSPCSPQRRSGVPSSALLQTDRDPAVMRPRHQESVPYDTSDSVSVCLSVSLPFRQMTSC